MLRVRATTDDPTDTDLVFTGVFASDDSERGKPQRLCPSDGSGWTIGLGEQGRFDAERARVAAAAVIGRATELGAGTVYYDGPEPAGFVEGALLSAYRFDRYKSEPGDPGPETLVVRTDADLEAPRIMAEAQNAARDLANAPPNELTPTRLAARARALAAEFGLACEVLGREQIRYAGMGAFAAVAQGSEEEPQLITLRYTSPEASGPVLGFVGKAVTFDSGGISIKPGMKMSTMKSDMSGGAAVLEAIGAIARLGLPVDVIAVIGATENLPDGRAVKPGDIVRSRSGTTIEIINTDAEGRLVLSDCLTHAREQGAERLIDVATLTGGIVVTLGSTFAGLFASDDDWAEAVRAAGAQVGERYWRLPLDEEYADSIKGAWSDITNANEDRKASSITAAEFLHRFVGDTPWVHLDIAGVGWDSGRAYAAKGGSGFATRTLVEVARNAAR
ncbi:MAG: leucyl aminopeptidase family protein [Solirubrobacteraceae bacterium]